jgi:predicted nucleic acid-binding protein
MPDILVITDTSCLIVLSKLNMLNILNQLYSTIIITEEIAEEFGEPLPDWIQIKQVLNKKYQLLLEATLDRGESSAIALAIDLPDSLLIIDDLKGRKEALRLGLKITGTLGILYKAGQQGFIEELKPVVDKLEEQGFRISSVIKEEILKKGV